MRTITRAAIAMALAAFLAVSAVPAEAASDGTGRHGFAPSLAALGIADIQTLLAERGYRPGPADGRTGPATEAAIRHYQRDAGLPETGIPDPELQNHLRFAYPKVFAHARTAAAPRRAASPPRDPTVAKIQKALAAAGFYRGAVDGIDGPMTRDAIIAWQIASDTPVDPRPTAQLLAEIRDAASRSASAATDSGPEASGAPPATETAAEPDASRQTAAP